MNNLLGKQYYYESKLKFDMSNHNDLQKIRDIIHMYIEGLIVIE